jgi:DNA-binding transcriptional MerR regulator
MKFDDLPWLLRPADVERLCGVKSQILADLGDKGKLKIVRLTPNGYRYYTKGSVQAYFKIEGNPDVNL